MSGHPSRLDLREPTPPTPRPWLGIRFSCSGAYLRVFRSPDASHYLARCPSCGKSVTFRVGPQGTGARFFQVDCA